jgi:hypothetical protein
VFRSVDRLELVTLCLTNRRGGRPPRGPPPSVLEGCAVAPAAQSLPGPPGRGSARIPAEGGRSGLRRRFGDVAATERGFGGGRCRRALRGPVATSTSHLLHLRCLRIQRSGALPGLTLEAKGLEPSNLLTASHRKIFYLGKPRRPHPT